MAFCVCVCVWGCKWRGPSCFLWARGQRRQTRSLWKSECVCAQGSSPRSWASVSRGWGEWECMCVLCTLKCPLSRLCLAVRAADWLTNHRKCRTKRLCVKSTSRIASEHNVRYIHTKGQNTYVVTYVTQIIFSHLVKLIYAFVFFVRCSPVVDNHPSLVLTLSWTTYSPI